MLPLPGLLPAVLAADPAAPRLTCYDDLDGPTRGERVELSARVLAKWVAKAANALQEEFGIAPAQYVRLALAPHWRSVYWALATWTVGAAVALDDAEADLVVTDDLALATELTATSDQQVVLVTRASLARAATVAVPSGAMDEARELATYGDVAHVWEPPRAVDPALRLPSGEVRAHGSIPAPRGLTAGTRLAARPTDTLDLLEALRAAWTVGGSLVLAVGTPEDMDLSERWASEAVTASW